MQNIFSTFQKENTFQLRGLIGETFRATVIFFILIMTSGEAVARSSWFQSLFIAPAIGSPHRQLEMQFGKLRKIYEKAGKIDCIALGSSTVWEGLNPIKFKFAYQEETGGDFSCFNFGVDGLTPVGAGELSKILVEKYHPRLLIYGTEPRDYAVPVDSIDNTTVIGTPWIQYQLGKFSITGWLYENSYLMKYQKPMREVLHLQFYRELSRYQGDDNPASWGYQITQNRRVLVSTPPSQNRNLFYVKMYYEMLSKYTMLPENISGLEQVLSLQKKGVRVLVVEMPVAPGYIEFFNEGQKDYDSYTIQMSSLLEASDVPYLRADLSVQIPLDGWLDYNHLNATGGTLFSQWLGREIGKMYLAGTLFKNVQQAEFR